MNLILHATTQDALRRFLAQPSHAVLIEGHTGSGKGSLAAYIASSVLKIDSKTLFRHPFFQLVTPVDGVITIEAIRSVQRFMRLKTVGKTETIRRILIVEDVQTMTLEAQNAFLKLLEEPPADTLILLTVVNQSVLLPTIRSRVQYIRMHAPSKPDLERFFSLQNFSAKDISRTFHISQGQVGLMSALLAEDRQHPLIVQIEQAKKLLSMPVFERLAAADQLAKQRVEVQQLVDALQLVIHAALVQASAKSQLATVKRWHRSLGYLTKAQKKLTANPNLKLVMTDLLLHV